MNAAEHKGDNQFGLKLFMQLYLHLKIAQGLSNS